MASFGISLQTARVSKPVAAPRGNLKDSTYVTNPVVTQFAPATMTG